MSSSRECPNGTRDAGPAETTVAVGILREILLVILLRVVELGRRKDFGGHRSIARTRQHPGVGGFRGIGRTMLSVAVVINRRAILRADVVSLPHPLRWIVALPENPKQLVVADLLRVEHHEHDFSVPGSTAAHLAIDGIGSVPSGIADGGRIDAGKL